MAEARGQGGGAIVPISLLIVLVIVAMGSMGGDRTQSPPGVQVMPMLQDPEAESYDWDYEVWAASPEQAASKCRQAAEQQGLTTFHENSLRQVTKRPSQYGDHLYKCSMSSEVLGEPYYVPEYRNP